MNRHPFLILLVACLVWPALAEARPKTDVVVLKNGDTLTGEVKNLEAGILQFSTDAMGTVYIEWRYIEQVRSSFQQRVQTTDGTFYFGTLTTPEESGSLKLQSPRSEVSLTPQEVVSVWPIESNFWDRIDLYLSVGFDYAKSTEIANLNGAFDASYRDERHVYELNFRTYITQQEDADDQVRNELTYNQQYLLENNRYRAWFAALINNEALGIRLRTYVGGGLGEYWVKTNTTQFNGLVGILALNEESTDGTNESNVEVVGSLRHRYFRFADPERSFDTLLSVFPSVTDFGRYRADLRSTYRVEVINDLFWSLEAYGAYDSDPLTADAQNSDWGVTTSVGWSY